MTTTTLLSLFYLACTAVLVVLLLRCRSTAHRRGIERQSMIAARIAACALPLGKQFPAVAAALRFVAQHLSHGQPFDGYAIRRDLEFGQAAPELVDLEDLPRRLQLPTGARDEQGLCTHPYLPALPEDADIRLFLLSFGFRAALVSMDADCADPQLVDNVWEDGASCLAWTPTKPAGDGWNLLDIFDSEDGPQALFARPMSTEERREHAKLMQYREDSIGNYQRAISTALQEHHAIAAFAADKTALPSRSSNRITRLATKHIANLHAECDLLRQERDDARAALSANA